MKKRHTGRKPNRVEKPDRTGQPPARVVADSHKIFQSSFLREVSVMVSLFY